MSIDQTSQLIQLMLNSVLMMAICGSVAIGLIIRQKAIVSQLRLLKPLYGDALNGARLLPPERFLQIKAQLRLLRHHYRLVRFACWSANAALMLAVSSTLLLALRTLVLLNRLIPVSLLLFTAGTALLLLSIVLGLLSLVEAHALGDFWGTARSIPDRESEFQNELKPDRSRSVLPARAAVSARSLSAPLPLADLSNSRTPSRLQPQYPLKPPRD